MKKCIIAIGGGEIRDKTTLNIDRYIAKKCKERATFYNKERATALMLPTASHDSLPYFNSFRKTYTSIFGIKAELALLIKNLDFDSVKKKFECADMLYVGGGDTRLMLDIWKKTGAIELIKDAYERGVIISGLSAGAICWFNEAYSDWNYSVSSEYSALGAMNILDGICCPHYDERQEFDGIVKNYPLGYAIENNCAIEFIDEKLSGAIGDKKAYIFENGAKKEIQK